MTNLLIDRIKKASSHSRIITTDSVAHRGAHIDFDDLQFEKKCYSGIRAYGQSKLANILFTKELARRLKEPSNSKLLSPRGRQDRAGRRKPVVLQTGRDSGKPLSVKPAKGCRYRNIS